MGKLVAVARTRREKTPLSEGNNEEDDVPPGTRAYDIVERMVENNQNNVELLAQMYGNLETFRNLSPYYEQAVNIVLSLFGGG